MTSIESSRRLRSPEWEMEWQQFLGRASQYGRSIVAQQRLMSHLSDEAWAKSREIAQLWQDQCRELLTFCSKESFWSPLQGLEDLEVLLLPIKPGAILDLSEIRQLRLALIAMETWEQFPKELLPGPLFKAAISQMESVQDLLRRLEPLLTPEGELSERASPQLQQLNREIDGLKAKIQSELSQLVNALGDKGFLQDRFHDLRDGRYVLPVKVSDQQQVEGIIYDASATGKTVFIEPRQIERLNNQLRRAQNDRQQEIYRILQMITAWILPEREALIANFSILTYWDTVQAKARLGQRYAGKWIELSDQRTLSLVETAHPSLWWSLESQKIIRNTIHLNSEQRVLLLTGPNTGGKTVLLKTIGMAGICARTGFPFPGNSPHQVPFFDQFYVDLGDPQNMEAHLSSFSGHIMKMKIILETVTSESLILIDELNTATDPEEGSALGRAVLETLISQHGPFIVTTTHDPHLKSLSYMDEKLSSAIVSAGMAFDEEAMEPTYHINLGVPGRSRALEVAEKLGMPAAILQLAKQYVSKNHQDFEGLLTRLEQDLQAAEKAKRRAEAAEKLATEKAEQWRVKLESSVDRLMDQATTRFKKIALQAQDEIDGTVKRMKEGATLRKVSETKDNVSQQLNRLHDSIEEMVESIDPQVAEILQARKEKIAQLENENQKILTVGDIVRVSKWRSFGTLLEAKGKKFKVRLGVEGLESGPSMTLLLSAAEIRPLNASEIQELARAQKITSRVSASHSMSSETIADEIDLRGLRLDDAMKKLEHYLDNALRAGKPMVRVIHGLATGALREGTRQLLQRLPYVKSFADAPGSAGGAGATVIELE